MASTGRKQTITSLLWLSFTKFTENENLLIVCGVTFFFLKLIKSLIFGQEIQEQNQVKGL